MPRLRGVLHVHSTLSDGAYTPARVRELAMAAGYRFAILCEHTKRLPPGARAEAAAQCREASDDEFLSLFGLECSFEGRHVLLLGPEDLLLGVGDEEAVLTPERMREAGALTIWAHPAGTSFWTLRRALAADYDGWEVWNGYCDGPVPSFPTLALLVRRRLGGRDLKAYAGADYHDAVRHTLSPALEVEVPELTGPALIEALRTGAYSIVRDAGSPALISSEGATDKPSPADALYARTRFALLRLRSLVVFCVRAAQRQLTRGSSPPPNE